MFSSPDHRNNNDWNEDSFIDDLEPNFGLYGQGYNNLIKTHT